MPPAGPPAPAPVASRAAKAVVMALLSHTERALGAHRSGTSEASLFKFSLTLKVFVCGVRIKSLGARGKKIRG